VIVYVALSLLTWLVCGSAITIAMLLD